MSTNENSTPTPMPVTLTTGLNMSSRLKGKEPTMVATMTGLPISLAMLIRISPVKLARMLHRAPSDRSNTKPLTTTRTSTRATVTTDPPTPSRPRNNTGSTKTGNSPQASESARRTAVPQATNAGPRTYHRATRTDSMAWNSSTRKWKMKVIMCSGIQKSWRTCRPTYTRNEFIYDLCAYK